MRPHRYQPYTVTKKPKTKESSTVKLSSSNRSLDDIGDQCLIRIIGHALKQASIRNDEQVPAKDNGTTEKNLSLVSKRWYFLTQSLIGKLGVHRIELDKITRGNQSTKSAATGPPRLTGLGNKSFAGSRIACISGIKRPEIGQSANRTLATINNCIPPAKQLRQPVVGSKSGTFDICLYRQIRPRLLKYKHILIDGSLTCDEFKKLVVAVDSARIEQLELRLKIDRDKQAHRFDFAPPELKHLEKLVLFWHNQTSVDFSNGLTWTVFIRASHLKVLEVHLNDGPILENHPEQLNRPATNFMIEDIALNFIGNEVVCQPHEYLERIIFKRTAANSSCNCVYSMLIKSALTREEGVFEFATNDGVLVEHLIRSSERTCTQYELSHLRFLTPIEDVELLGKLFLSGALGRDRLTIEIDTIDYIDEIRMRMEYFKLNRHEHSICQLSIHLKDQKVTDFDDKIKSLIHLCRSANVTVFIDAQWRVSIDCCHLMWSIGRALQQASAIIQGQTNGDSYGCLFKINLQVNAFKQSFTEITIPFGSAHQNYCINSNREDMLRHREIMRSLKRDCYHQFVKAVRDNMPNS